MGHCHAELSREHAMTLSRADLARCTTSKPPPGLERNPAPHAGSRTRLAPPRPARATLIVTRIVTQEVAWAA